MFEIMRQKYEQRLLKNKQESLIATDIVNADMKRGGHRVR